MQNKIDKSSKRIYFEGSIIATSSVFGHKYMLATCSLMVSCKCKKGGNISLGGEGGG
jgi:hypothetical protein